MKAKWEYIEKVLSEVYGKMEGEELVKELQKLAKTFPKSEGKDLQSKISEKDAALIIYANSIIDKTGRKKPLQVLEEFIDRFKLKDIFTVVHILPFYPWDTDRGFSVKDYFKVNPEYGDWEDIKRLSKKVRLMFDFVLNHASVENPLVQKALIERHLDKNDPRYKEYEPYKDFVIAYSKEDKPSEELLKKLARPRPNPVLTPYVVYEVMEDFKSEDVYVFIDASNFIYAAKRVGWRVDFEKLFYYLKFRYKATRILFFAGRIGEEKQDRFFEKLREIGYELYLTDVKFFKDGKAKADVDSRLTLEVMKNIEDFREAIFLTGDEDYYWLFKHLQEKGKKLRLISFRHNTARKLRKLFGARFTPFDDFKALFEYKKKGRTRYAYSPRGIMLKFYQRYYLRSRGEVLLKTTLKACLGEDTLPEDREKVVRVLGKGYVWTTFSRPKRPDGTEDTRQVDLNYANPKVFLEAVKIILFYIQKGAKFLRLDATAYLWKELGTPSVHLRKTHLILRSIRAFLDMVAPDVVFIAEVNERQSKVFEYFGDKEQVESDLVYQFTNFALALYSLLYRDGRLYAKWYKTTKVAEGRQFITVLGSHDGMGVKPLRDLLTTDEIEEFAQRLVKEHGGLPNFAFLPGGRKIVYEVCSTPWNLINGEKWKGEEALRRYFLIVALGLMVKGLPAFYINGLFGAKNYFPQGGLDENRTVNRQIFTKQELFPKLEKGFHAEVLKKLVEILKVRASLPYFSPWKYFPEVSALNGGKVLKFEVKEKGDTKFLTLYNLSEKKQKVDLGGFRGKDVFGSKALNGRVELPGFSFIWAVAGS